MPKANPRESENDGTSGAKENKCNTPKTTESPGMALPHTDTDGERLAPTASRDPVPVCPAEGHDKKKDQQGRERGPLQPATLTQVSARSHSKF